MTKGETISKVGEALVANLSTEAFLSTDDYNDSFDDIYSFLVALAETRETYGTINLQANLTYYNFAELLPNYLRVIAIFSNQTNRWLDPVNLIQLQQYDSRWEIRTNEPHSFWPVDSKYVAVFPRVSTSAGTLLVFYKQKATTLNNEDTPDIPDENTLSLESGMVSDLLDQFEEFNLSLKHFDAFKLELAKLKQRVNRRQANLFPRLMPRG